MLFRSVDVEGLNKLFEKDHLSLDTPSFHPVIATKITNDKLAHLTQTSLDHILETENPAKDAVYRARLSVLSTVPQTKGLSAQAASLAIVKVHNTKTGAYRDYDGKSQLKKDEKLALRFDLIVQDYSLQTGNEVVRIHVADPSKLFRGVHAEDLVKAATKKAGSAQEKVWQTLVNLHKFNVHMECVIGYDADGRLEIRDTEVKEY